MMTNLMYSICYIPHPWNEELREQGVMAYCLCREIRLPVEPGNVRGVRVSWEPVAMFNFDNEGQLFEKFCSSSIDMSLIEPSDQFLEINGIKLKRAK